MATTLETLTEQQEQFVWNYICFRMNSEDRSPVDVVREDYQGNRSEYLRTMAEWYHITFCPLCRKMVIAEDVSFPSRILCDC